MTGLLQIGHVTVHPTETRPSHDELCAIVAEFEIVVVGVRETLDQAVATAAHNLQVVATLSAGLDHIDVPAFEQRGISVLYAPGANAPSVAEHTWALLLSITRHIRAADDFSRREAIDINIQSKPRPADLNGRLCGVIGAGHVGARVAAISRSFGCRTRVWTPHPDRHQSLINTGIELVDSLAMIFEQADIISFHLPLTASTRGILSRAILDRISQRPILINTARAELIDRGVIPHGIETNRLLACGLDVYYENEVPLYPPDRVILSPHIAGLSGEAIMAMRSSILSQLKRYSSS